jgi:hypothetical protein
MDSKLQLETEALYDNLNKKIDNLIIKEIKILELLIMSGVPLETC